jgi:hypothetical protein
MGKVKEKWLNNNDWEAYEPETNNPTDEELEHQYNEYINKGVFKERQA